MDTPAVLAPILDPADLGAGQADLAAWLHSRTDCPDPGNGEVREVCSGFAQTWATHYLQATR